MFACVCARVCVRERVWVCAHVCVVLFGVHVVFCMVCFGGVSLWIFVLCGGGGGGGVCICVKCLIKIMFVRKGHDLDVILGPVVLVSSYTLLTDMYRNN